MATRNRSIILVSVLCFWYALCGCGTEGVRPQTSQTEDPEPSSSCASLEPLVLQPPLTGGEFHCLWCNRKWTWAMPVDHKSPFILVALKCERLRSRAYLELRDANASVVWQREIEQGEDMIHCLQPAEIPSGPFTIHLRGTREFLMVRDLIEEFRGSVYLKVFDERGYPLEGPVF